jgi:hypothetical protein
MRLIPLIIFVYFGTSLAVAEAQINNSACDPLSLCNITATYNDLNQSVPEHMPTGDANLDRAVSLCDAHRHIVGQVEITTIPPSTEYKYDYDNGWNDKPLFSCDKIYAMWDRSTTARKELEAKAQARKDLNFIQEYAKSLK